MSDPGPDLLIANLFHASDANLIIMTGQEIAVNIPQTLDPVYSNMIQIAYKDDEFTFVFLHQIPGVNQARAKAIVSITPAARKKPAGCFHEDVCRLRIQVRQDRDSCRKAPERERYHACGAIHKSCPRHI